MTAVLPIPAPADTAPRPADLRIVVHGNPAPQGSKMARPIYKGRGAGRIFTGKVAQVESSKNGVNDWRGDVKRTAEAAIADRLGDVFPLDGPLVVRMVFTATRPLGHYRTGRNAHLLRDAAPARPQSAPDLSKLIRSTEDALTAAGVWRDDSRVVEYERTAKVWAGEDPEALPVAGAVIEIRRLSEGAR